MRVIRISLAVLGLFILIFSLAIVTLMMLVNPNKLKPVITQMLMQRTGYQLTIDGNLSWALFPRPSLKIQHMMLTAPKQSSPFLDLQNVKIATQLSQLWNGKENLSGKIYIENVKLMSTSLQNLSADLQWQHTGLILQPIKASLYGGSLEGSAEATQLSSVPHWKWDVQLKQVQLQPLLQDLNGADSKLRLTGVGEVTFKGYTDGKGKTQLLNNINGDSEFSLHQGVIEGINLNYFVQLADALIQKQAITAPTDLNQTRFDSLVGRISIKDGLATTKQLQLISPAFVTDGTGSLTLASQEINLQLQVKPQRNTLLPNAKEWEIPVLVTGSLKKPKVQLNLSEAQSVAVNQEVDKAKTKARAIIKEHISGKAGDFLQNLLGK